MKDDTAWLIERTDHGYPEWIARGAYAGDEVQNIWTTDANLAHRFPTEKMAGTFILLHLLVGKSIQGAKPTEHMWCSPEESAA